MVIMAFSSSVNLWGLCFEVSPISTEMGLNGVLSTGSSFDMLCSWVSLESVQATTEHFQQLVLEHLSRGKDPYSKCQASSQSPSGFCINCCDPGPTRATLTLSAKLCRKTHEGRLQVEVDSRHKTSVPLTGKKVWH
jgi:hypothetical protein